MSKFKLSIKGVAAFLLFTWVLGAVSADPQSPKVKAVDVKVVNGVIKLAIHADKAVQFRTIKVNDPEQALVFEVFAVLWGKKETKPVNQAGIRDIRVAQFSSDPDVMRVVLDLSKPVKFTVTPSENRHDLAIDLQPDPNAVASVSTRSEVPATSVSATKPVVKAPVKEVSKPVAIKPVATRSVATVEPKADLESHKETTSWQHIKIERSDIAKVQKKSAPALVSSPKTKPTFSDKSLQAKLDEVFVAKASKKRRALKHASAPPETVNYSWKNADLVDVVRSLADRMHLNVIVDTAVKGSVTLDLKNVPASQALGMILAINGYSSRQIGNILVVAAPDKLDKIPTTPMTLGPAAIQVIPLENAKATELRSTITTEYPNVRVDIDPRTNALLVRGSVGEIRQVKGLVSELDKPVVLTPPVPPQKEVVQLNYSLVKDVLAQVKPLVPSDAVIIGDDRLNALIVIGSQYAIDTVKAFVSAVDVPSPQVMLAMEVVSVETENSRDLGILWPGSSTSNFVESAAGEGGLAPSGSGGTPIKPNTLQLNNIGFHAFVRDNIGFAATLNILVQQRKAKVLGSPRVATVNNKEATIQLGDRLPIVYFDPRAGLYQVQYIDVGVILKVTPTISPDGNITVHVAPQVSEVTSFVQNYPQLSTRQADTTLRVKNGETIVLGGLLRDNNTETINKVPLLGDIPIIGEFFRNRQTDHLKDELIVSITPTLLANK